MAGEDRYRVYAAEISYFSAKVRPFLRYKEIPFKEIPPTGEIYREVILPRTGLGFIPVVVTPEEVVRKKDVVGTIVRPALREGRVLYAGAGAA